MTGRINNIAKDLRRDLFLKLREELRSDLREAETDRVAEPEERIRALIERERYAGNLSRFERRSLASALKGSVQGLDVLEDLLADPEVSEIMVNGPDRIFIEKAGRIHCLDRRFESEERLEDAIRRIVGSCNRVISESSPIADARLADGSRVNAVISPVALDGPVLTIRHFPDDPVTMKDLMAFGTITPEAAFFLQRLVEASYSFMISGGTSAGKTTFLNALSLYIPEEERVVTIEDNAELQLQKIPDLVRLEAKAANMEGNAAITIRDLIRTALRMRPDRLLIGEVRGAEAAELLMALNTGHEGSLSTIHANSAGDVVPRLLTLALMGMRLPEETILSQIASGIDILVHLGRMPDKSRKVLEITEIVGMEAGHVRLNPIFARENGTGELRRCGELLDKSKLIRKGVML